jgi:hypothetical protein
LGDQSIEIVCSIWRGKQNRRVFQNLIIVFVSNLVAVFHNQRPPVGEQGRSVYGVNVFNKRLAFKIFKPCSTFENLTPSVAFASS